MCNVDLNKMDSYPDNVIPDEDCEVCLKVLRTLRNVFLDPKRFDAERVLILTHAHAIIVNAIQKVIEMEKEDKDE